MWDLTFPLPSVWRHQGDRSSDKKLRHRAMGSPESLVSAVLVWLYSFRCTTSQEGLSEWVECAVERGESVMPTSFQNFMRKARLIKETLSASNVTMQISPHSIACHSWGSLKRDIDKAWHDGITKWHCHTCPAGYDKRHPGLREVALPGVSSPTDDNMTKLLS